jgi:AraC-like DNA-binding protein/mannose-6-phosphate isomerase-like protein (cupin superfamily)
LQKWRKAPDFFGYILSKTNSIYTNIFIFTKKPSKYHCMEPSFRLIQPQVNRSFVFKREPFGLHTRWHYHPEVELIFLMEGGTSAVVGDGFQEFEEGDLVLLGANLPHVLQESKSFVKQNPEVQPFGLIVQFVESFLGDDFLQKPEFRSIRDLLQRAKRGLRFRSEAVAQVSDSLKVMHNLSDSRKLLSLLEVLLVLAESTQVDYLTSQGYTYDFSYDEGRMRRVHEYVYKHFAEKISVADVAAVANMTESSFCRYFKSRTLKHFSHFLNEVRIAHACKVLRNGQSVMDACVDSGFNSQAHFNKKFLEIMQMSPRLYQQRKG